MATLPPFMVRLPPIMAILPLYVAMVIAVRFLTLERGQLEEGEGATKSDIAMGVEALKQRKTGTCSPMPVLSLSTSPQTHSIPD